MSSKFGNTGQNIADYLVYLIIRMAICVIQSLSPGRCRQGASLLGWLFADILRVRRKIIVENLSFAFPQQTPLQQRQLIRELWEHLFLLVAEVALAPRKINETNWWHYVRITNPAKMRAILHQPRPAILVTGHVGNFEIGGYILGLLGYPTYSVAREINNRYVHDFIKSFREVTGQYLISKKEGYEEIIEVLKQNEMVAFLADHSPGAKGCRVDFLGRKARAYKAMALLSLEYDAPIFVAAATRLPDSILQFDLNLLGVFDPRNRPESIQSITEITQWFTAEIEQSIRNHPNQYWWIHRRWKDSE